MRISDWSSDGCSSDLPRIAHYVLVEIALSQPACEPRDRAVQDALALRDRPVHEIQDRNEKEKRSRRRDTDDEIAEESHLVLGKTHQKTTMTSTGSYDADRQSVE